MKTPRRHPKTFRLPQSTVDQLESLADRFGSQANVITIAVDRLHQQEKKDMSRQKERITRKLNESGMAWAVTSEKTILPNDGFDAKPTYHVHPNVSEPNQQDIQRFASLDELEAWMDWTPAGPDDYWEW